MEGKIVRKNFLTFEKKKQLVDDLANKITPEAISKKYSVSLATVYKIKNNSASIIKTLEDNPNTNRKRIRNSKNEINLAVYDFFVGCRSKNIPISGPMLQTKALIIAKHFEIENFKASNGWLEKFKLRHGIEFKDLCGESAEVNCEIA